ncbi:MAG: hypothetical protein KJZ73_15275 [Pseudorhodoplanes sp.]|nr:hypothetical protein [Pseudorhodoplanes sp.]MCL4712604.1 hypothetical protein [Pseudorhodoplanes sp.]GIK81834.1 MAG: hypothetical protein BroJett024_29390 [Alphaproteobacteria bacterium]
MSGVEVRRRCVFFLGGYEPIPAPRQHERFVRELRRFKKTWNAEATVSDLALTREGAVASWTVATRGPDWAVDTEYRSLIWGDIVESDFSRPEWVRVPAGIAAFADFILSGTALRYFVVNWRYGLFFAYPVLILLSFVVFAFWAASAVAGLGLPYPALLTPLVAFAIFCGLIVVPGRFLMLAYMLDDWIFAAELIRRSRAGLDARIDTFAREVADRLDAGGVDEFVFAGHSLGCALKLAVVDRALALRERAGRAPVRLNLVSTGSSLLKIALHPKGAWLKEAVDRVVRRNDVFWIEYQTLVDIISFYKVNPVEALRLPPAPIPLIQKVRVRHMLDDEVYNRYRGNFFRLHRQLVMGNDKRYFYDYFMICCGPFRLETRARDPERMMRAFRPDGTLADAAASTATEKENRT